MNKRKYAIGITYGLVNWELAFEFLHDEYFEGIELPAYYLNNPKLPSLLEKSNIRIVNVVDLVQNSILRNITEQNPKLVKDIFEQIYLIITKKYNFSFDSFILNLGFDAANNKKETTISKVQFLKQFLHILYSNNMTISLPVRVPETVSLSKHGKYMMEIIHETMYKGYKICLNLFPHEVKKNYNPKDIFQWYEFDLKTVRIIYEPETGNYLTDKVLEYWINPLDAIGFKGNIIFCPKTKNFSLFENEIRSLTHFIDKTNL